MSRPLRKRNIYGTPSWFTMARRRLAQLFGRRARPEQTSALAGEMAMIITAFSRVEAAERREMADLRLALHARERA